MPLAFTSLGTIFRYPALLLLLLLLPLVVWQRLARGQGAAVRFSSLRNLKRLAPTWTLQARHVLVLLRVSAIGLAIIGLARPQWGKEDAKITTLGIDIMLAVDISPSMEALDFKIDGKPANRLAVAKMAVEQFVKHRENDRLGLVVFAKRAYLQCPLTLDYDILLEFLRRVEITRDPDENGTAIGAAIGTSVARLVDVTKGKDNEDRPQGKVIILLTDGRNNVSYPIKPEQAVEIAKSFGVRIYTIGAGTKGNAPFPVKDWFGNIRYQLMPVDIDDDGLRKIAEACGGQYFRATDTKSLQRVYKQIDKLERTKKEVTKYAEYDELFGYFCLPALLLLLLEIGLANTVFRKIP